MIGEILVIDCHDVFQGVFEPLAWIDLVVAECWTPLCER